MQKLHILVLRERIREKGRSREDSEGGIWWNLKGPQPTQASIDDRLAVLCLSLALSNCPQIRESTDPRELSVDQVNALVSALERRWGKAREGVDVGGRLKVCVRQVLHTSSLQTRPHGSICCVSLSVCLMVHFASSLCAASRCLGARGKGNHEEGRIVCERMVESVIL